MYLDPGFGGMLIQIIVAIVAAGGALLFALRKKIKALFSKNKKKDSSKTAAANTMTSVSNADEDVIDLMGEDNNITQ